MSQLMSQSELRRRAMQILVRELGFADAMRFMHEFDVGLGDYTKERATMLPNWTVSELMERIESMRKEINPPPPSARNGPSNG